MGTGQRALILQDAPIHIGSNLVIIIIVIVVVIVVITAYILSSSSCFLLPLLLLFLLLPCLLVPLGRDAIPHCHNMILRQWHRVVLED